MSVTKDHIIELDPESLLYPYPSREVTNIFNPYITKYVSSLMEMINRGEDIPASILNVSVLWPISVTFIRPYNNADSMDRKLALAEALATQFSAPDKTLVFSVIVQDPEFENKKSLFVAYSLERNNFINFNFPFITVFDESDNSKKTVQWLEDEFSWDKDMSEVNILMSRVHEHTRHSVLTYGFVLQEAMKKGHKIVFSEYGLNASFKDIKTTVVSRRENKLYNNTEDTSLKGRRLFLSLVEENMDLYLNFLLEHSATVDSIEQFLSESLLDSSKY